MQRLFRIGCAIIGVVLLISTALVIAQDDVADCTWAYKDGYSVDLGKGTFEECAQALLDQITQFGLEEGYAYWGEVPIYTDYEGNIYFSEGDGSDEDDWVEAGKLSPSNPESSPNTDAENSEQEPSRPLTLNEVFQLGADDIDDFWSKEFAVDNDPYERPRIVLFNDRAVRSGCGVLRAEFGPVYCPPDNTGYFPRDFMVEQMEQVGDFAVVVIMGHEWGHAVQMQANLTSSNNYTIDNELQADCFAGAYSQYAQVKSVRVLLEEGDIDEGATAIFLVGDPEGTPWFDENAHGTGEQRLAAFKQGLENGYQVCLSGGLR